MSDCFCTDLPHVVFTEESYEFLESGASWDFNESPPKTISNQVAFDIENWVDADTDEPVYFTATVYDIEVEEFHSYYVGKLGLWVHDGSSERPGETSET